jgi:formate dehydrogenase major subunit
MMRYGIPAFRLPDSIIDREIAALESLGARIECGRRLGRDFSLADLKVQGFEAIFLGIGAQAGRRLGVPGEESAGVISAVDFLREVRRDGTAEVGRCVAVVGGGFTAVDAARTALRLGADEVFLCYRRTRDEMPAVPEEVWEAEEEGVRVIYLVAPVEIISEGGEVSGLRMLIHTLGESDASGRRRPDAVRESEFTLPCDMVIDALGQVVGQGIDGLRLEPDGALACDSETGVTALEGVFAGGDAATGTDTVIAAVASGRRAAVSIDRFLSGDNAYLTFDPVLTEADRDRVLARSRGLERKLRLAPAMRSPDERREDFGLYTSTMTEEEAVEEAGRCLSCGCGAGCGLCERICSNFAIDRDRPDTFSIDEEKCVACGMCFRRCPNQNIEMVRLEGTI